MSSMFVYAIANFPESGIESLTMSTVNLDAHVATFIAAEPRPISGLSSGVEGPRISSKETSWSSFCRLLQ